MMTTHNGVCGGNPESLLWNECGESDSSYVEGSHRGKGYAEYSVRMLPRQKPHKLMIIPELSSHFYALLR